MIYSEISTLFGAPLSNIYDDIDEAKKEALRKTFTSKKVVISGDSALDFILKSKPSNTGKVRHSAKTSTSLFKEIDNELSSSLQEVKDEVLDLKKEKEEFSRYLWKMNADVHAKAVKDRVDKDIQKKIKKYSQKPQDKWAKEKMIAAQQLKDKTLPETVEDMVQQNIQLLPVISDSVRQSGMDLTKDISKVSDRVASQFKLANTGQFSDILTDLQTTSELLKVEPEETGLIAKIKSIFVKAERKYQQNRQTAEEAFTRIIQKVDGHIAEQETSHKNMDDLRVENYSFYERINVVIKELTDYKDYLDSIRAKLVSCPEDAPDAYAAVQQVSEVDSLLRQTRTRLSDMSALRAICEQNGTIINQRRDAARDAQISLEGVKTIIPEMKTQFTIYMAALSTKAAIDFSKELSNQMNTTFTETSDFNKKATIEAREMSGKNVVKVETLKHMQDNIIETINKVKDIDSHQEQDFIETQKTIEDQRSEFFNRILKNDSASLPDKK